MKLPQAFRSLARAALPGLLLAGSSLLPVTARAVDRFVGPTGQNNTNSGRGLSVGSPYLTIDYAADQAAAGDTIYIRGGTYRETVTPTVSGTVGSPITFKPYNNEAVTISGLNVITPGSGGAGQWEVDSGSVYRIQLTGSYGSDSGFSKERITGCQVFVDGQPMSEARWPNVPTPLGIRRSESATADEGTRTQIGTSSSYAASYIDSDLAAFATDVWKDGIITYAAGSGWYRRTSTITGNTPNGASSTVDFTYSPYNTAVNRENPNIGDPFFLMGRRVALDSEREYFFDTIQGATSTVGRDGPRHMLYLQMPGSVTPVGHLVEMRTRQLVINIATASNLRFEDLRILGGRVKTATGTANCVFKGVTFDFPCHTWQEQLGDSVYAGVLLAGTGHQIIDSQVRYSTGSGIVVLSGSGHLIRNTVISDCFLSGIEIKNEASNVNVENVTVYNLGGCGISAQAVPGKVLYSHGYFSSLFSTDIAFLNANNQEDSLGSEWAYNWLHDVQGARNDSRDWYGSGGLRLDSGPTNYLIHHNVIWNTTHPENDIGMWAPDSDNANYQNAKVRIYNNTLQAQIGFIETSAGPASVKGFELINNLTGTGFNLSSSSTDATGKLYLTDIVVKNNVFPNKSFPDNPTPPHSANRQGSTGWTSASTPPLGYRLSPSSQAINHGITIPGITDGFVGTAPDIGALESGLPMFVPGAKVRAQDLAGLTITPTVVGNTVKFVVTGLPAGRNLPDTFKLKIGSTAASGDFSQSFDFINNVVTISFNALSVPGAGQTVQASLDGITFIGLPTAVTVPTSSLAATTTNLSSNSPSALFGNTVTFTATVAAGSGTPAGTVTFLDGNTTLGTGTLNGSGIATFATSNLTLGLHSITVSFPASASHAASTSPIVIQSVQSDSAPAGVVRARFTEGNGSVTAQQYPGTAGDGWLGAWTPVIGTASVLATPALASGSGNYLKVTRTSGSGSSSLGGVYRAWDGGATVRPINKFTRLTFDYRIDSDLTVFNDGGDAYMISLNSAAGTAPGTTTTSIYLRSFGASPGTDANGNTIRAQEWCVFNGIPGTADAFANNKFVRSNLIAVPGHTYTFAVDIYAADAAGTTGGKTHGTYDVTITDRADNATVSVLGSGFRSAAYTSGGYLAFGDHQNLATDNLAFSVDSIEMTGLPTTTTLATSGSPAAMGTSVTFTATVASGAGTPAGTVTFFDGGAALGTGTLNASGLASFTTSTLPTGSHSITASYGAAPSYATSTAPGLTQSIQTPLEIWRAQYFTPQELGNSTLEATLWGDAADPDQDGLNNTLERALGGEPRLASAAALPKVGLNSSGQLTLTFKRAASDLTYLVQATGNLPNAQSWTTIATNPGVVGQIVVVPDNVAPGPVPRFLRLRVNP